MARDLAELTQLFREAVSDHYGLLGDGTPASARLYFSLGTPLPDDGFRTPDGSAYFPLRAQEFMSHHCNVAPRLLGDSYFATINQVDELYGLLLKGSSPVSAADTELLGAVKMDAKAAFDTEIGSTFPPGFETFRPTHSVPELWFDQTQSDNWSTISIAERPKNRMPNLVGLPADPLISLLGCVNLEDVDHCLQFLGGSLNPLGDNVRPLGEFFFSITRSGTRPDVRGDSSQPDSIVKSQFPLPGVDVLPGSALTIEVAVPPGSGSGHGGVGPIFNDGLTSPFPQMFRPIDPRLLELVSEPISVNTIQKFKIEAGLGAGDASGANPSVDTQFVDFNLLSNAVIAVTPEPQLAGRLQEPHLDRMPDAVTRARKFDADLLRSATSTILADELRADDQMFRFDAGAIRRNMMVFTDGVQVTSSSFRLEADVCFVSFRRPWLSAAFLQLKNWFVQSFEKGELAKGSDPVDGSPLAAIPTGCILVRNLRITADWTGADQAQSMLSSHMGIFSLMGRSFDSTTAVLSVPGMQSVAWLCQPMPTLPPQPTPL